MPEIEVEAKFRLPGAVADWRQKLLDLGAVALPAERQSDEYFAHPARDFVRTGEAFRIRTVREHNALTYKGPLLDATTKSRREIEVGFDSGERQRGPMRDLLMALGFRPVATVSKQRTPFEIPARGQTYTVALDEVDRLGLFVEIEILAAETDWTSARDSLVEFAAQLGLHDSERRSYLELLLALPGPGPGMP